MALLIEYHGAAAIQEQTLRRPFPWRISEGERDSRAFFNFWCCYEIWFGLNRTSHPDWVKTFGDSNGQIKLRAKKKFKFLLSATKLHFQHDIKKFSLLHRVKAYSNNFKGSKLMINIKQNYMC